jgi:hypothetical protein
VSDPIPGSLLVYPDLRSADGGRHDGNVGLVIEASDSGMEGTTRAIHRSLGKWKTKGDAVQETGAGPWEQHPDAIIVWLDGMTGVF